jgi:peptidylprolyl isomerase
VPTDKRQRQKEGQRARREAAMAAARRQQRKRRLIVSVVLAGLVVGLFSLLTLTGGDDKDETDVAADGGGTTTIKLEVGNGEKVSVKLTKAPPTKLVKKDLEVGEGPAAELGDQIEVNYVGIRHADGKQFESSFESGQTATFGLTPGGLIEGWVQGIPGMKVGGRRQLTIPSEMAYGDAPEGGRPAGALIFIVELVAIK